MKRYPFLTVIAIVSLFAISCSQQKENVFQRARLSGPWRIMSADSVQADGAVISKTDYDAGGWYKAHVPTTVLHALVENGVYKDIFVDDHLAKIPQEPFRSPWWYRTEFSMDKIPSSVLLKFDGINYRANIWLNGKLVADTTQAFNSFMRHSFDVTSFVVPGKNVLAVEVVPPRPGDYTIGFVDWNPAPPDKDMGLFRPVWLETNGGVEVSDPFVVTALNEDHSQAALTASVMVTNRSEERISGDVVMTFRGEEMNVPVTLKAGESRKVLFKAADFEGLTVDNPVLWWPHTLGNPHLYQASFSFTQGKKVLDQKMTKFGIRTVGSFFNKEGYRGFLVNGKKIQIHGGGWTDRMMLDDTRESLKKQLAYVKDVNLNTIRLEGFWGNSQTLYDLADSMGIMIMVGWSCHWEWPELLGKHTDEKYGGILSEEDMDLESQAWRDQIVWLRNHPAIFAWYGGSDLEPKPELEKKYFKILKEYDSTRVYLASAKSTTTLAGPSGVKMEGPYAYVPPVYWFSDSIKGGAFGFATEIGPGAQVPPAGSIKKMLSEEHWWPIDEMWDFHSGRGKFSNLDRFRTALEKRYGKATSLEEFEKKAQLLNYELMRPMFEAYSIHRYKATGLILWMLNSAWPEMYWQLYDYYLNPNAAYYGAKTALRPYHVVYDYYRKTLYAVNDRQDDAAGLKLKVRIYDVQSNLKFEKEIPVDLKANSSQKIQPLDRLDMKGVYFIDTRLYNEGGEEVDRNFYWISPRPDLLDYDDPNTAPWVHTATKQYADFTEINTMPRVEVKNSMTVTKETGQTRFEVILENKSSTIAFFIHAGIVDQQSGETILPVLWSDNYVSLLPGEKRNLTAVIVNTCLAGKTPKLEVTGYNLK